MNIQKSPLSPDKENISPLSLQNSFLKSTKDMTLSSSKHSSPHRLPLSQRKTHISQANFTPIELLVRKGKYNEAEIELKSAITKDPTDWKSYYQWQSMKMTLRNLKGLNNLYEKRARKKKNLGWRGYRNWGYLLFMQGEHKKAEEKFSKAYELHDPEEDICQYWAHALFDQGKYAEAEIIYRKVQKSHPEDIWALFDLGHVLLVQGKEEEAEEKYCEAFAIQMKEKDGLDPYREIVSQAMKSKSFYIFSHYFIKTALFGLIALRKYGEIEKAKEYSELLIKDNEDRQVLQFLLKRILSMGRIYEGVMAIFYGEIGLNSHLSVLKEVNNMKIIVQGFEEEFCKAQKSLQIEAASESLSHYSDKKNSQSSSFNIEKWKPFLSSEEVDEVHPKIEYMENFNGSEEYCISKVRNLERDDEDQEGLDDEDDLSGSSETKLLFCDSYYSDWMLEENFSTKQL